MSTKVNICLGTLVKALCPAQLVGSVLTFQRVESFHKESAIAP